MAGPLALKGLRSAGGKVSQEDVLGAPAVGAAAMHGVLLAARTANQNFADGLFAGGAEYLRLRAAAGLGGERRGEEGDRVLRAAKLDGVRALDHVRKDGFVAQADVVGLRGAQENDSVGAPLPVAQALLLGFRRQAILALVHRQERLARAGLALP